MKEIFHKTTNLIHTPPGINVNQIKLLNMVMKA